MSIGRILTPSIGALTISLLAAGCVSEAGEAERIENFERQFDDLGLEADGTEAFGPAEVECLLDEARSRGIETLTLFDIQGDATTGGAETRAEYLRAVIACTDDLAERDEFVQNISIILDTNLGDAVSVDLDEGRCTLRHLLDNAEDPARALAIGTSEQDIIDTLAALEACLPPDEYAALIGAEGAGPQAVGDSEELDDLVDRCRSGADEACDLLYWVSPIGSEYEAIGIDCDGRSNGFEPCTRGLVEAADGTIDPSSPGLMTLRDDCTDGEMLSCDLLFRVSPLESDLQQHGHTCAGRIIGAIPNCRTRLGDVVPPLIEN